MSVRTGKRAVSAGVQIISLALGALVVFPVIYGVLGAFRAADEFTAWPPTVLPRSFANFENFRYVFSSVPMLRYLLNSLLTATLGSALRLGIALLAAYAVAFFSFRGKKLFQIMVLGTMMLPGDIVVITNYQTVTALGLNNSLIGIIIVFLVGGSQMFMLRQSFLSIQSSLREAAELDGCGDIRFIISILIPVSMPVISTLFLQSFVFLWNTYLWPLMITSSDAMRTVQVGIAMLTTYDGTNFNTVLAGVAVSLAPILILFLAIRRKIAFAMTAGSVVG